MARSTFTSTQPGTVRVGAVQMLCSHRTLDENVETAMRFCGRAGRLGVKILCFPEAALTGYDWQQSDKTIAKIREFAEPIPGPMVNRFAKQAEQIGAYLIVGTVERPRGSRSLYNSVFVVGPREGYMGRYRKAMASGVFSPGREAPVFQTPHGAFGVFICHDSRYPEPARLLALKGAQILFQPTNYTVKGQDAKEARRMNIGRQASSRSRGMENGLPLIVANAGVANYVNDSRILTPAKTGPEFQLARATKPQQLIYADIEVPAKGKASILRMAKQFPWLFREYADALKTAAGAR